MQALHDYQCLGRTSAAGRLDAPKGSISDELLIRALQPLSLLQIGLHQQLLGGCHGQVVNRHGIGTLDRLAIGTPLRVSWGGAVREPQQMADGQ